MAGIILSADIGTSSLKAAFIDFDGKLLAFSRVSYGAASKGITGAGSWERAFAGALETLHALAPDSVPDGICISGNGPTLVPLTGAGEALPPLYWYGGKTAVPPDGNFQADTNAAGMTAEKIINPAAQTKSLFLPYAAYFKKNRPAEYEKTHSFVSSHEWLAHRLGAELFTVLPSAAYKPYYWDDDQCRAFGLHREKFPPFINMGETLGRLSAGAASRLGCSRLKSGTPIIAGGPDFITALIGTGTLRPGDVCDRAGSSEGINVCAREPLNEPPKISAPLGESVPAGDGAGGNARSGNGGGRNASGGAKSGSGLRVLPHAKEGLWNISALLPSSGRLFEQYRSFTGQEGRDYEEQLAELIPSSADTAIFETPFFFPPIPRAGTLERSFEEAAPASSSFPRKISLGRAVLCAIGFAVRSAAETLAAAGFPVREMRVSGGQGKNPRWNQLKSDISGLCLLVPEIPDGELAGNAVISAAALEGSGVEETAKHMIRFREVYRPRPETVSFWEERRGLYRQEAAARQGVKSEGG